MAKRSEANIYILSRAHDFAVSWMRDITSIPVNSQSYGLGDMEAQFQEQSGSSGNRTLMPGAGPDESNGMRIAGLREFRHSLPEHMLPTRPDLILGFAVGYAPHAIAPFVETVRTDGKFEGQVVLFVDPEAHHITQYLKARNIETQVFDRSNSEITNLVLVRIFAYFQYLLYCYKLGAVFDQILLTDVRDVIFQKPLFGARCDELEFHLEASFPNIGECPYNSVWIERAFGKATLRALSSKNISCAGTVSGRAKGMFNYLIQMQMLALELSDEQRSGWGIDQALHNYVLYNNLVPAAGTKANFVRVATLQHVPGDLLTCDDQGRVINPNGEISEIAHQWDRHTHLREQIRKVALQKRLSTTVASAPLDPSDTRA